ncbi:unnamed protein product [Calicophoron daubneyi]|uniref:Uncharacterized protein n=1 Tax=Calicophoron daubneyi TaxID=300641 RepID=A0AAV2T3T4_CALDB
MQPIESIQPYFSNSDESLPCCDAEEHFQPRRDAQSVVAMGSNSTCVSCMRLRQHHQRRLRSKHLKQLFPEPVVERQTNILRPKLIPTCIGLLTVLVVLLGLGIAVFRSHKDSTWCRPSLVKVHRRIRYRLTQNGGG